MRCGLVLNWHLAAVIDAPVPGSQSELIMITLDEGVIDAAAPNADAAKNGRALVLKGKFLKLFISEDETILFGECQGSGKEPYQCSSDFQRAEAPTHRCNCPSRQFPCKHSLGLMSAYAQKKKFTTAAVPDELQAKREKLTARAEKKVGQVVQDLPILKRHVRTSG